MTPRNPCKPKRNPVQARWGASLGRRLATVALVFAFLLLAAVMQPPVARSSACTNPGSDGCPDECVGLSEDFQVLITVNEPGGAEVTNGAVLPVWSDLRIDSLAIANGQCITNYPESGACTVINVQERVVHSIKGTETFDTVQLGGTFYTLGAYGISENGTAFWHVLDTTSSDSTGPNYVNLFSPGAYTYTLWTSFLSTSCDIEPGSLGPIATTIYAIDETDVNNGPAPCQNTPDSGNSAAAAGPGAGSGPAADGGPLSVGEPINVATGNMFLQQIDYRLPGLSGGLRLTRTFNSHSKQNGRFGYGWQSSYEERVTTYGGQLIGWRRADGRVVYFARDAATGLFQPVGPLDVRGQIVFNANSGGGTPASSPSYIPQSQLSVVSVDSEEVLAENGVAINVIDGNPLIPAAPGRRHQRHRGRL